MNQILNHLKAQLSSLKLNGISANLDARLSSSKTQELNFESLLSLLLQDEIEKRNYTKKLRLIKRASFSQKATLENFDLSEPRGVTKKTLSDLKSLCFLSSGMNIIFSGPTGVGKSFLSQAVGHELCNYGKTVLFYRVNNLLERINLEKIKNNYLNFIKKTSAADLLILDDFGIKPLEPEQYQNLYDIIENRGEDKSILLTTQIPVTNWNEIIEDPVVCEAVTDRLESQSLSIEMTGDSYRPKRGRKKK